MGMNSNREAVAANKIPRNIEQGEEQAVSYKRRSG
jgi:hypothetical protein